MGCVGVILHSSLNSKRGPANGPSGCMFSVSWGTPASWLSTLSGGSWHIPTDTGDMLCSQQPLLLPFVSFLHEICILFQVTHLALWGPDLLLVRQAHGKDKVCFHLKDVGMGPRWAWWMCINFSWLSYSNWDMQFSKDISVSFSKICREALSQPPTPKESKTKHAQAVISFKPNTKDFQENHSLHPIICPSLLAEICLVLKAIQEFTKFALWACIETVFSSNLGP